MIRNDRQYRITKAQAERFAKAMRTLPSELERTDIHPLFKKAQVEALKSQYDELCDEVAEYETLKSGSAQQLHVKSFDELPRVLIQARVAVGLSQKGLAERLGLKEQQIQRYEATAYSTASLSRIGEVVDALGIQIEHQVLVQRSNPTFAKLLSQLGRVGLPRDFVLGKLLSEEIVDSIETEQKDKNSDTIALRAGSAIGNLFGWSADAIFGSTPLSIDEKLLADVRFKFSQNTNKKKISAYTLYAILLGQYLLDATSHLKTKRVPFHADDVREAILKRSGVLSFEAALEYVWSLGIPVLPLNDSGMFHGACLRVDGRNVIILKQVTRSSARWLTDLIHELKHASQDPDKKEFTVIDEAESAKDWLNSPEEQEAIQFAAEVSLNGRAEELAKLCVDAAKGNVRHLKSVVPHVATKEKVPVGSLANYMAYRLSLQDINWWGAANNLQLTHESPWESARDMLMSKVDLTRLNVNDRGLLLRALS